MVQLRALRRHTYGRLNLREGDSYEIADPVHAKILVQGGFAEDSDLPPPRRAQPDDTKEALRAQAEAAGIEIDGRWSEARLRQEIADAVGRRTRKTREEEPPPKSPEPLSRRDMAAEEPANLSRKDLRPAAGPGRSAPESKVENRAEESSKARSKKE